MRPTVILLVFLWSNVDFALSQEGAALSPESENVPEQSQVCPDLHSLLKDMENKLSDLQIKMETINLLQEKVQWLERENTDQADELRSLKSWTNMTESDVESLKRDRVGRVAFSASLRKSGGSGYSGPYDSHTTLVYRRIISNIGDAYDKHTGIFTAPVGGAYHFEFHFKVLSGSAGSFASLMKNGERVVTAHEEQSGGFGSAGNSATLVLQPGDLVFVQIFKSYGMFDDMYHSSTFSGRRLFPL